MDCFSTSRELITASRTCSVNASSFLSRTESFALLSWRRRRGGKQEGVGRMGEGQKRRGEGGRGGDRNTHIFIIIANTKIM